MRLLMKLLAPVLDDYEPVLVMDVYQSHCTREVLQLAWLLLGLKLLFVPSLCTWLLQPCDVSYFARFKRAVRIAWTTAYAESGGDGISHVAWVRIAVREIASVVRSSNWTHALRSVGLLDEQKFLSSKVMNALGWSSVPALPPAALTDQQLRVIFPVSRRVPATEIFGLLGTSPTPQPDLHRKEASNG